MNVSCLFTSVKWFSGWSYLGLWSLGEMSWFWHWISYQPYSGVKSEILKNEKFITSYKKYLITCI